MFLFHAGMARAFSRVCLSVCLSRSNRKTAWAINTKLGKRIIYSIRSAGIDPEVKRSKVTKTVTVARLLVTRAATTCMSVESTAYVFYLANNFDILNHDTIQHSCGCPVKSSNSGARTYVNINNKYYLDVKSSFQKWLLRVVKNSEYY